MFPSLTGPLPHTLSELSLLLLPPLLSLVPAGVIDFPAFSLSPLGAPSRAAFLSFPSLLFPARVSVGGTQKLTWSLGV